MSAARPHGAGRHAGQGAGHQKGRCRAAQGRRGETAGRRPVGGRGYQPEFYGDSPLTRADLDPSFGGVKFVVDGSIQGYTGLFQWPGATTRLSPTESRTSPKTTSPSGSPRCTSAGSKP